MSATTERFISGGHTITADVFAPVSAGRHPAVLILHGTFGLLPPFGADIISFGQFLEAKGIVAVIPHYFERTNTAAGPPGPTMLEELPAWRTACADALQFVRVHSAINAGRLGMIGFSLGGNLALELAMNPPSGVTLKAIVDFFGPTIAPPVHGNRAALPPVLIHHGADDAIVPIENSLRLVQELRAAGRTQGLGYEFITYPGQGHGFVGPALVASRASTVDFLSGIL
ncbi:MAG: dienelactone hydrolase family protein [bacterium]